MPGGTTPARRLERRMNTSVVQVGVVYLRPGLVFERVLLLPAAATVATAIDASRIRALIPELARSELEAGIFGRPCAPNDLLHDGDRVEIYRPLSIDPKDARRIRVDVQRRRRAEAAGKVG
jgi:putative ubiquitin-RnfH superfamily antitoxin RatB of RatAB toxin-antitoxin module